jgi:glycosyltransferase involved in cell wall biosynthesis
MEHRLISIITPTYNHADFIGACIESVQAQQDPRWEMLVINDGSTDDTAAIVQAYADKDSRIKLFHQENVGLFKLAQTYNFALDRAQGDYIAILEGDDLWESDKLTRQIEALTAQPEAVLCWSEAWFVGKDLKQVGRSLPTREGEAYYSNTPVGNALNQLYLHNCMVAATLVIKKTTLLEMGGFKQSHDLPLVDFPTLLALATRGPFVFVDRLLANWRWHPGQATKSLHVEIIKRTHALVRDHFGSLDPQIRNVVHLTEADIERCFADKIHEAYTQSGRYRLIQKKFREARADYMKALWYPGWRKPAFRLHAIIGYIAALFKMDLEWLGRLMGKTRWT